MSHFFFKYKKKVVGIFAVLVSVDKVVVETRNVMTYHKMPIKWAMSRMSSLDTPQFSKMGIEVAKIYSTLSLL